ncbi:C39 family peptidase [[Eubacterium] cellulosolvens]
MRIIERVDEFPINLRQDDPKYGCIPTSIVAVLIYHGYSELDERSILEKWGEKSVSENIAYDSINFYNLVTYVIKPLLENDFSFEIKEFKDSRKWIEKIKKQIENNLPPIIAWRRFIATARYELHTGVVLGFQNDLQLRIYDPAMGNTYRNVEEMLQPEPKIRTDDILIIIPLK